MYSLCNGKEFVLYSVRQFEPVLRFNLQNINEYWDILYRILNQDIKANHQVVNYYIDYGLHLRRLGVAKNFQFMGFAIHSRFVCKVQDNLYTVNTIVTCDIKCLASFDFNEKQLHQLLSILPNNVSKILSEGLKRQPCQVLLKEEEFKFGVVATLTDEIINNAEESYIPFKVQEFMPYRNVEE